MEVEIMMKIGGEIDIDEDLNRDREEDGDGDLDRIKNGDDGAAEF